MTVLGTGNSKIVCANKAIRYSVFVNARATSLRHVSDTCFCSFWDLRNQLFWYCPFCENLGATFLSELIRSCLAKGCVSAGMPAMACRHLASDISSSNPAKSSIQNSRKHRKQFYSSDVSSWISPKKSISGMECFKLIPGQHLFRSLQGPSADLMVVLTKGKIRAGEKCLEAPRVICGFDSGWVWTLNNVFLDVLTVSKSRNKYRDNTG